MPILTPEDLRRWREDGFFVLRNVVDSETVAELRGVVKNILLTPDPEAAGALVDHEPEQPAETRSFEGRMARYRKHNAPGTTFFPLMWHECIAGAWCDVAAEMAPHLGGGDNGDVLVKFNSSFVKQPNGGAATPWHRELGSGLPQAVFPRGRLTQTVATTRGQRAVAGRQHGLLLDLDGPRGGDAGERVHAVRECTPQSLAALDPALE